jgi:transposase
MDAKELHIQRLIEENAALKKVIAEQAAMIGKLLVKIAELEKRINKNSSNSSKPPSSDGFSKTNKKKNKSLREKGKNKSGGQLGHPGETLKQVEHPDRVVRHTANTCTECQCSLAAAPVKSILKRQVFDIPVPRVEVTEHQAEMKNCPKCQAQVRAKFPQGVNGPVQYGPVIQSYSIYLQIQQLLPEDRLQQLFSDLFNVNIASATLNRFSDNTYKHLEGFEDAVLENIRNASVKHLDETGFRITGKTRWLHVASNAEWTYYHHSPKRKSLLAGLKHRVVHDHWRSYYQLDEVQHVLCNAHHLRELKSLMEDKERWAYQMSRLLRLALRIKHYYQEKGIPHDKQKRLLSMYDEIVVRGFHYHEQLPPYTLKPKRGQTARRSGHNLLHRLKNYRSDVVRFIVDPKAPFTNNQAEQDLRMMKVKQKISGTFRSEKGASNFVRIRGFISTAKKQGWDILESISQAATGTFLLPA